jgi:hypothetical protein
MVYHITGWQAILLLACVREVLGSSFLWEIGYPERIFVVFLGLLQANSMVKRS